MPVGLAVVALPFCCAMHGVSMLKPIATMPASAVRRVAAISLMAVA
jgi:hypothetical protein